MDHRGVIVTTHSGMAVGMGSLRVTAAMDGSPPRVDLHFETPTMRCVLGIPPARLDALAASWNGGSYRYALPAGDKVWMPHEEIQGPITRAPAPVIETFPLPPQSTAPVALPLKKWTVPGVSKRG